MPSGMAATMREQMENENKEGLVLERSPWSKTGFVNVIKVKGGKFQARLQVPGDGRGGQQKRKQCSLPGIFNTAEEAAELLAVIKRDMKAKHEGRLVVPPKQISERKARGSSSGHGPPVTVKTDFFLGGMAKNSGPNPRSFPEINYLLPPGGPNF